MSISLSQVVDYSGRAKAVLILWLSVLLVISVFIILCGQIIIIIMFS